MLKNECIIQGYFAEDVGIVQFKFEILPKCVNEKSCILLKYFES